MKRVCRFVRFLRNLADMIVRYWCTKVCRALKIFEIFFSCDTLANFLLANFRDYFLKKTNRKIQNARHTFIDYEVLIDIVQFVLM